MYHAITHHPDAFVGLTHVTAPERQALANLLGRGLVDVDAARWGPGARRFTWWQNGLEFQHNPSARVTALVRYRLGHYYNGDYNSIEIASDYRFTITLSGGDAPPPVEARECS